MVKEKDVVKEVEQYLSKIREKLPSTTGISSKDLYLIETEHPVWMGISRRRADVVLRKDDLPLILGNEKNPLIVVECKTEGKEGDGVKQLQSYLCATGTRFGICAASLNPGKWKYYKNHDNSFERITDRLKFEKQVIDQEKTEADLEKKLADLEKELDEKYKRKEKELDEKYKRKEAKLQADLGREKANLQMEIEAAHKREFWIWGGFWIWICVIAVIVIVVIASGS